MTAGDELVIADRSFRSRLFLGTGKFPSGQALSAAIRASGTEVVTVALRRIDPTSGDDILDAIPEPVLVLTNTSGRRGRRTRRSVSPAWPGPPACRPGSSWRSPRTPATCCPTRWRRCGRPRSSWQMGSPSCPTARPIPILCRRLEEAGCATVMPLGSWIGSNQGLRTRAALEIIVEQAGVPVVVDAGLGAPSHAAEAMELGAGAVLVNTAIGTAGDPGRMGRAFRLAVEAGRPGGWRACPRPAGSRPRPRR